MALSYNKLWKNETVSMDVLLRICKVLKCDISDIIEIINEEDEGDGNQ